MLNVEVNGQKRASLRKLEQTVKLAGEQKEAFFPREIEGKVVFRTEMWNLPFHFSSLKSRLFVITSLPAVVWRSIHPTYLHIIISPFLSPVCIPTKTNFLFPVVVCILDPSKVGVVVCLKKGVIVLNVSTRVSMPLRSPFLRARAVQGSFRHGPSRRWREDSERVGSHAQGYGKVRRRKEGGMSRIVFGHGKKNHTHTYTQYHENDDPSLNPL